MTDDKKADEDILRRAAIDRSARLPVLFFFTSAAVWLTVAVVLGFIQSIKFYAPGFLDAPWLFFLNYGRSNPAFMGGPCLRLGDPGGNRRRDMADGPPVPS